MKLKKELGLIDVFGIAAGAMISSGLFILPGLVYMKVGPIIIVAYLFAGLLMLPSLFSQIELYSAQSSAKGEYYIIQSSMGSGLGTIAGIAAWLSLALKSAFAFLGIGIFTTILFPSISYNQIRLIALFFCLFFMFINMITGKHSNRLHSWLVILLLVILAAFVLLGIDRLQLNNFSNFNRGSSRDLFATAGFVFIAYTGLSRIYSIAEDIKNPDKNLPLGMILSFVVVAFIYILVIFTAIGILGDRIILPGGNGSLTPISDAAQVIGGRLGMIILAIVAVFAFISAGNSGLNAASLIPSAMSKDKLLPHFLSKINSDYQTSHLAIICTVAVMAISIVFLDLELLIIIASTISLILFTIINLAIIILRESRIQNYQPKFRSPLYPWLQIFAIITYVFLIYEMGNISILISIVFISGSYIWYQLYGKIHSNRESALLNIVRKIKSSELDSADFDKEIREIISEREFVNKDRFDEVIENCPILDIEKSESKEEFFARVAGVLCQPLNCGEREIFVGLINRENESSTVLSQNLAIPHVVLEGEKKFEIVLARSQMGVFFSEAAPTIRIIFVIAGTKDERQFHLQSLSAIAQLVQQPDFQKKWLKAQNIDELRKVILMAERARD